MPKFNEGCSVIKDGVCAMHGAEIERRKSVQKNINDIEGDIKTNKKWISELLSFKNQVTGFSLLLSMILGGSYTYTYLHTTDAKLKYSMYESDIRNLRDSTANQRTQIAITNERYDAVNKQLSTMNRRLSQLVDLLLEGNGTKKIFLENYQQPKNGLNNE